MANKFCLGLALLAAPVLAPPTAWAQCQGLDSKVDISPCPEVRCNGIVDVNRASVEQLQGCYIPRSFAIRIQQQAQTQPFEGFYDLSQFLAAQRMNFVFPAGLEVHPVTAGIDSAGARGINVNSADPGELRALLGCGVDVAALAARNKSGTSFSSQAAFRAWLARQRSTSCATGVLFRIGMRGDAFRL